MIEDRSKLNLNIKAHLQSFEFEVHHDINQAKDPNVRRFFTNFS